MSGFVTSREISEQTGVARATLYRWIARGIVPPGKKARRNNVGGQVTVWPLRVIEHIRHCQKLLSQKVPFDDLPQLK